MLGSRREVDSGVFPENTPCFSDHLGTVQANVVAMEQHLRVGTLEVRARVGHDPVARAWDGRIPEVEDDRMGADRWIDPQVAECGQERMFRSQFADGGGVLIPEAGNEKVRLVLSQKGLACLAKTIRPVADPRPEVAERRRGRGGCPGEGSR